MLLQSRKSCFGHGRGPLGALPNELSSTYLSWEYLLSLCAATWVRLSHILVIFGVQSGTLSFLMLRRCKKGCFGHEGGPLGALSKELGSRRNRDVAGGHYVRDVLVV